MTTVLTCPRCREEVRAPGLWSDSWTCPVHGDVAPLHPPLTPSGDALLQTAHRAQVPLWVPWPLPPGWLVSGLRWAGDDHTGPVATVVAVSGPNPLPDAVAGLSIDPLSADVLFVAEQPGIGLGPRLAGIGGLDPGAILADLPGIDLGQTRGLARPHLAMTVAGHVTKLWTVPVEDGAAYVGEASGVWLWALAWPESAAAVLLEPFELRDLRDPGPMLDLPLGALSPRLY